MESKVKLIAGAAEAALIQQPQRAAEPDPGLRARPAGSDEPVELRLVIEKDSGRGSYVYKTVDRRTGEIVQQFPRDQILRMHEEADYAAGDVVRAKA